jgi:3-oxoacyl-[acyl-carrier-protein] synthase II
LIASLCMMERGIIYPTRNLDTVSPECDGIHHVTKQMKKKIDVIVKNCFAFGGINAALVCRKI